MDSMLIATVGLSLWLAIGALELLVWSVKKALR